MNQSWKGWPQCKSRPTLTMSNRTFYSPLRLGAVRCYLYVEDWFGEGTSCTVLRSLQNLATWPKTVGAQFKNAVLLLLVAQISHGRIWQACHSKEEPAIIQFEKVVSSLHNNGRIGHLSTEFHGSDCTSSWCHLMRWAPAGRLVEACHEVLCSQSSWSRDTCSSIAEVFWPL